MADSTLEKSRPGGLIWVYVLPGPQHARESRNRAQSCLGDLNVAICGYCRSMIFFGGRRVGEQLFCNERCVRGGQLLVQAHQLPESVVAEALQRLHGGRCPRCQGPGPVDVFTSYTVASCVVITWWTNEPQASCRRCATKRQLAALATSLILGWWGIHGLIMTPVQVVRNLKGLRQQITLGSPSPALEHIARLGLAAAAVPGPETLDLGTLIKGLRSPQPEVREQSASILGDRGAAALAAVPDLEALLHDPVRIVRIRAKWAIETIHRKSRA